MLEESGKVQRGTIAGKGIRGESKRKEERGKRREGEGERGRYGARYERARKVQRDKSGSARGKI